MFGQGVTEVRGKYGSCYWSQTHQTPSRTVICCTSVVNLRNIPVEPHHDRWCGCLHDRLCKQIVVHVWRRYDRGAWQVWELLLVANASNAIADCHLLHQVVNLRNIPVEPPHDRWCGCVHGRLCKQKVVYIRARCNNGAWQVWELLLVTNASNAIADYHLLHRVVNLRNIPVEPHHDRWCGCYCMVDYANKKSYMFGEGMTEVRGKCGSCFWSQTHQTPSRTVICCTGSESQKYPCRTTP